MSFWNSKQRKARKEHTCMYCGKRILIGEIYSHESGCIEGYMENYCLCDRCKKVLPYMKQSCETNDLGNLIDEVIDSDMLMCPECGSCAYDTYDMSQDHSSINCKCDNGHEYTVDLSFDSIRDYFVKRDAEEKAYRQHLEDLRKRGAL